MVRTRRLCLAVVLAVAAGAAPAAARTIAWSGYNWDVRTQGLSGPGPNYWSDSTSNVSVEPSGVLDLSVVRNGPGGAWTSSELDGETHLGYGRYTWVVDSNLSASALDNYEVLGLFTYDDNSPERSHNEIDIEASHWGDATFPTGSGTVYHNSGGQTEVDFPFSSSPPYICTFDWTPGQIHWTITDMAGATLADWTETSDIPVPATEVPVMNLWRFENRPPASLQTIRIASFTFVPYESATPPPPPPPPPSTNPPPHRHRHHPPK